MGGLLGRHVHTGLDCMNVANAYRIKDVRAKSFSVGLVHENA